jgi:hypothetical protein
MKLVSAFPISHGQAGIREPKVYLHNAPRPYIQHFYTHTHTCITFCTNKISFHLHLIKGKERKPFVFFYKFIWLWIYYHFNLKNLKLSQRLLCNRVTSCDQLHADGVSIKWFWGPPLSISSTGANVNIDALWYRMKVSETTDANSNLHTA